VTGLLLALTSLGGVSGAAIARRIAALAGTGRAVLICKVAVAPFGLLIPLAGRGAGLALFLLGSIVLIAGIIAGNIIWSGFVQATIRPACRAGRRPVPRSSTTARSRPGR
jgi:hypothetical protein